MDHLNNLRMYCDGKKPSTIGIKIKTKNSIVYKGTHYEFWLSLCKIVRSSVILLLPLLQEVQSIDF